MHTKHDIDIWESINCPICNSDQMHFVTHDWQTIGSQSYTFTLVRCDKCHLVYVNPRLRKEAITTSKGGGAHHDSIAFKQTLYEIGCRKLKERLDFSSDYMPKLLDVGCGYGSFLKVAQKYDFDVTGIEINEKAVEGARKNGFVVYDNNLEDLALPEQMFDVVTLWDVIEHVDSPKSLLTEAARLLRPGGILFFHTGNAAFQVTKGHILAKLRPGCGPYNIPYHHLYHFSPQTSRELLRRIGEFEQVEFTHFDTLVYPNRTKYVLMKGYNTLTYLLSKIGLPLWTTTLAVFATKANKDKE